MRYTIVHTMGDEEKQVTVRADNLEMAFEAAFLFTKIPARYRYSEKDGVTPVHNFGTGGQSDVYEIRGADQGDSVHLGSIWHDFVDPEIVMFEPATSVFLAMRRYRVDSAEECVDLVKTWRQRAEAGCSTMP